MYDLQDHQIPCLRDIVDQIEELCSPDGTRFASPGLGPNQSIRRMLNPNWDSKPPLEVWKFLLDEALDSGIPFWGLFDLLGLFLSSITVTPYRANRRNYYLPRLAVYGKWCCALTGHSPRMFNIT
ncbi:uncharacterized protein N7479_002646 [Penicillium vulpinum]|uniref:uncharacterized protein n=1 Tax=Penicillium vulpinum TaxID=29845 RepID=UPI0025481329|nr:uncharacterized protein N7479_002646 [Penicillium vulpinum]KAJ5972728.1 hypothetical protein N7479_002646 [Penicillium vulpinum]